MAEANVTVQGDLIIPEVFAGEIQKKMGKFNLLGLATVEPTDKPVGKYTISKQKAITAATVVAEGAQVPFEKITQTKEVIPFNKYAKGTIVTDEADLNSLDDQIENSSDVIANSLDEGLEKLIYSVLKGAKVSTTVAGLSPNTILEAFKSFGDTSDGVENYIVLNRNNYFTLQQKISSVDNISLHNKVANSNLFEANQLTDDEFFIVQKGAIQLRYSSVPKVEKARDLDFLQTKVVGHTIAGAWRADDTKVIKVTITPEVEPVTLADKTK